MNNKSMKFIHLTLYATSERMLVNVEEVKFFHRVPDEELQDKFKTRVSFKDGSSIEVLEILALIMDQI